MKKDMISTEGTDGSILDRIYERMSEKDTCGDSIYLGRGP